MDNTPANHEIGHDAVHKAYTYYSDICHRVNGKTFVEWMLDEWQIEVTPFRARYQSHGYHTHEYIVIRYHDDGLATMFKLRFG